MISRPGVRKNAAALSIERPGWPIHPLCNGEEKRKRGANPRARSFRSFLFRCASYIHIHARARTYKMPPCILRAIARRSSPNRAPSSFFAFRDLRPVSLEKGQETLRLRVYACYAWGGPFLVAGLAALLDHLPPQPQYTYLRPRFGEKQCWFYGKFLPSANVPRHFCVNYLADAGSAMPARPLLPLNSLSLSVTPKLSRIICRRICIYR